jgi:hypothetical protein
MPTLQYTASVSGLGVVLSRDVPHTADGSGFVDPTVPHGYAGTLSTRTDANTGTVTLAGGHAIITGEKVDIYWAGGVQYDVTVGTVATNSMPFDLGVGANLPIATTAVVVSKRIEIDNLGIDGDNLSLLAIKQEFTTAGITDASHIDFQDVSSAVVAQLDLAVNTTQIYDIAGGVTNPFTGNPITKAFCSNGSPTADAQLKLVWLQDTTP